MFEGLYELIAVGVSFVIGLVSGRCYMNGGGLPIIYGKKFEGGDG